MSNPPSTRGRSATCTPGPSRQRWPRAPDAVHRRATATRPSGTISYDPNARPSLMGTPDQARERIEPMVGLSDVVKASDEDVGAWLYPGVPLEEVLAQWIGQGVALAVLTLGGDGALAMTSDRRWQRQPATPATVVDTVGAGDLFMSGLISGLLDAGTARRRGRPGIGCAGLDLVGVAAALGPRGPVRGDHGLAGGGRTRRPGPSSGTGGPARLTSWRTPAPSTHRPTRPIGRLTSCSAMAGRPACDRSGPPTRTWCSGVLHPGHPRVEVHALSGRPRNADIRTATCPGSSMRISSATWSSRSRWGATSSRSAISVGLADEEAELALLVQDTHHGRGLGTLLLEHLAQAGRELGVRRFVAEVLRENGKMVKAFRAAGYQLRSSLDEGLFRFEFDIHPTQTLLLVMASREHRAEASSMARIVGATHVAIVGAFSRPELDRAPPPRNLVLGGFTGRAYPVHPSANAICGLPAYPSVRDVPGPVDLAIIATPADAVPSVVEDCAAKGVHGLVVISTGYAELGPEGGRRGNATCSIRYAVMGCV